MARQNQETITTFGEVLHSSNISYSQNRSSSNDNRLMIYFQGMKVYIPDTLGFRCSIAIPAILLSTLSLHVTVTDSRLASNAVVNSLFDGASTHRTIYPLLDTRSDPGSVPKKHLSKKCLRHCVNALNGLTSISTVASRNP